MTALLWNILLQTDECIGGCPWDGAELPENYANTGNGEEWYWITGIAVAIIVGWTLLEYFFGSNSKYWKSTTDN